MGRFKLYKKFIGFYVVQCGLKEPVQVLVTPEFLEETQRRSLYLPNQLSKIFNKSKICITDCVKAQLSPTLSLPTHTLINCKHEKNPLSPHDCIHSIISPFNVKNGVKSPYNYCIASMNEDVIEEYRKTRFPVVTYDKQIMKLCSPSPVIKRAFKLAFKEAKQLSVEDQQIAKQADEEFQELLKKQNKEIIGMQTHLKGLMKTKKAKGPNPLSMKKKNATKPKNSDGMNERKDEERKRKIRRGTRGNQKAKKERRYLKRKELEMKENNDNNNVTENNNDIQINENNQN